MRGFCCHELCVWCQKMPLFELDLALKHLSVYGVAKNMFHCYSLSIEGTMLFGFR